MRQQEATTDVPFHLSLHRSFSNSSYPLTCAAPRLLPLRPQPALPRRYYAVLVIVRWKATRTARCVHKYYLPSLFAGRVTDVFACRMPNRGPLSQFPASLRPSGRVTPIATSCRVTSEDLLFSAKELQATRALARCRSQKTAGEHAVECTTAEIVSESLY